MKNMMYMLGGVGVGIVASKYGKDIMKAMKKEKKTLTKTANQFLKSN
jgi:hypothetical protein